MIFKNDKRVRAFLLIMFYKKSLDVFLEGYILSFLKVLKYLSSDLICIILLIITLVAIIKNKVNISVFITILITFFQIFLNWNSFIAIYKYIFYDKWIFVNLLDLIQHIYKELISLIVLIVAFIPVYLRKRRVCIWIISILLFLKISFMLKNLCALYIFMQLGLY